MGIPFGPLFRGWLIALVWLADVREMRRYMFMFAPPADGEPPVLTGMDIVRPPRDQ